MNLTPGVLVRDRLSNIAELLIIPKPITGFDLQVSHNFAIFHQLWDFIFESLRINRNKDIKGGQPLVYVLNAFSGVAWFEGELGLIR